jgi:hypothetical protein
MGVGGMGVGGMGVGEGRRAKGIGQIMRIVGKASVDMYSE